MMKFKKNSMIISTKEWELRKQEIIIKVHALEKRKFITSSYDS